ncbi:hypothetical protein [Pseudoxanthomonas koreensis]|uniref:hypothetical protein n=1 Tax=Pseudoxanthomonas koreensis TaxID=266061 RepID=UPI001390B238|nr:hypothetical protein [Pseudoxanthomonas koreensis]
MIEHNNADLYGEGQWTGTPATADGSRAPLPEYPQPGETWAEFIRDGLVALGCTALVVSSFVGVFFLALLANGWSW